MKAAQYSSFGGVDAIEISHNVPKPVPREGQILAEVHAAALSPVDWKVRAGYLQQWIPVSFPVTCGGDFSGVVVRLGPGAEGWHVGDRVFGMASVVNGCSGTMAEFVTANAAQIARMPESLDATEAAALVLSGISATQAMDDTIHPGPGSRVLIHGGAGGVGSLAIQYAKHLGAYVATTARAERSDYVRGLGADEVIDYEAQAFHEMLHNYDAVLDTVGGETYRLSYRVLKPGGILVSLIEQPDEELMAKHQVQASLQAGTATTARLNHLADLVERGVLKPQVDKVFELEQAREAFDYLESGHPLGKVAVRIK